MKTVRFYWVKRFSIIWIVFNSILSDRKNKLTTVWWCVIQRFISILKLIMFQEQHIVKHFVPCIPQQSVKVFYLFIYIYLLKNHTSCICFGFFCFCFIVMFNILEFTQSKFVPAITYVSYKQTYLHLFFFLSYEVYDRNSACQVTPQSTKSSILKTFPCRDKRKGAALPLIPTKGWQWTHPP